MSYRSPKTVSIAHRARSVIDLRACLIGCILFFFSWGGGSACTKLQRKSRISPNRNKIHGNHQTTTKIAYFTKPHRTTEIHQTATKRIMPPNRNKIHGNHQTTTKLAHFTKPHCTTENHQTATETQNATELQQNPRKIANITKNLKFSENYALVNRTPPIFILARTSFLKSYIMVAFCSFTVHAVYQNCNLVCMYY